MVTVRWFSNGAPDASVVGSALSPPGDFGTPTYPFTWLVDPVVQWPYGWVLEKRGIERLAGTNLFMVNDLYRYREEYVFNPSAGS